MHTAKVAGLGEHRGNARLWLQGNRLMKSGFKPGCTYSVQKRGGGIVLALMAEDEILSNEDVRTVSGKGENKATPVVDINSNESLKPLVGHSSVRVLYGESQLYISPLASEIRRKRRIERAKSRMSEGAPLSSVGICAGGGVLSHALHQGFKDEGMPLQFAAYNEIREDLAEHAFEANDVVEAATQMLNMPLQELAFDTEVMARVGEHDVSELGLPCSGASLSGRAKGKLSFPEQHEHVGHLVVGGLVALSKINSLVCLFENVPQYANTASAELIRKTMADWGYQTHECLLEGSRFGELENRVRWCMVAVTKGIPFDLTNLEVPAVRERQLSEIMEPMEAVADRWSEMTGLKAKQERDIEAGKGFMMQIYDGTETRINTLTKGITKNRSTDPKFRHPENPDLLRIPTAREHARCKGVPEHLIDGLSQTTAHELLGQGICYAPFRAVAQRIAQALAAWRESGFALESSDNWQFKAAA